MVAWLASHVADLVSGFTLHVSFLGSLGGLMALAAGEADIAGCHLWDEETRSYNDSYVRRLFPGRRVTLITLAQRRLGLVMLPGNPPRGAGAPRPARPGVRFIDRQTGSGTRVWLDLQLRDSGLTPAAISGYEHEVATHSDVAGFVAEGQADTGLAFEEGAASAYGLDFVALATETYDLAVVAADAPGIADLIAWLATPEAAGVINSFGGYLAESTGRVRWVE